MATIKTELKGIVRISTSDTYEFYLANNGNRLQNAQAITNVEEVYIIIENTEAVISPQIVLPQISTFYGGWNVKIYIVNKQESPKIVVPKLENPANQDYINDTNTTAVSVKRVRYFHIVDNHLWASWEVDS